MRRPYKSRKRQLQPDNKYQSVLITKFINYTMKNGKKGLAQKIVYEALDNAAKELKKDPVLLFETALENVSPILEIRSKRIGGATYQVPMEVRPERKVSLAFRWILTSARSIKGMPITKALKNELANAYNKTGQAMKKREDMHKAAEANKAFAHFARF